MEALRCIVYDFGREASNLIVLYKFVTETTQKVFSWVYQSTFEIHFTLQKKYCTRSFEFISLISQIIIKHIENMFCMLFIAHVLPFKNLIQHVWFFLSRDTFDSVQNLLTRMILNCIDRLFKSFFTQITLFIKHLIHNKIHLLIKRKTFWNLLDIYFSYGFLFKSFDNFFINNCSSHFRPFYKVWTDFVNQLFLALFFVQYLNILSIQILFDLFEL